MKTYCFALAALAAIGFSGAALAGEAAHPGKAMSDTELDKVTAGDVPTSTAAISLDFNTKRPVDIPIELIVCLTRRWERAA
jgi:hypothetical protein